MDYESFSPPAKSEARWTEEESFWADSYSRRSPPERRRGRARSRSPVGIDRYQPGERDRARDEYYGAAREHAARDREQRRRLPSPGAANIDRYVPGQESKPVLRSNPIPNPLSLDYQVGFNYYAEWWRTENAIREEKERAKHGGRRPTDRVRGDREAREERDKERAQIQASYDAYKQDLQIKLARQFVQLHRNEEWFREKYVGEVRDPFKERLTQFRGSAYEQWTTDLASGLFDEFTLEGIYKSESDGAGGIIEKEEGEATAVGETLGVLDLVPARGGELRDDSILQPALLIKTLAPNVSREKIEEFSREHLGEVDGGFKWLSLSDPNPSKKYHRIGWIMLHPAAESQDGGVIERGDGRDEEGEEMDTTTNDNKPTVSAAEKALDAVNGKTIQDSVRGDFVCHVGVHVPPTNPRKKALWDLFSAPERIERDLELARRIVSKFDSSMDGADGMTRIDERVEDLRGKGWLQPPVTGPVKVKNRRFDAESDMILLDEGEAEGEGEGEVEEGEGEGEGEDEADTEDLLVKKKTLDLTVEYLRRVYNFCLYCVFESDSVHELVRKCPGGHLRRPRSGLSSHAKAAARASAVGNPYPAKKKESGEEEEGEASPVVEEKKPTRFASKSEQQIYRAFNWVKTFEDKLMQILEPEDVDLKKLGGKPVDEAVEEELARFVKQEDESKFRCKVPECTKLFKAQNFWRKHVKKRHEEWFAEIQNELALVNAYALDPAHISPTRSDAASNGHFPFPPGHIPAGTPRGFNYANMSFGMSSGPNSNGFNGMPPVPAGGPGVLNGSYNILSDPSGMHHPGVIRRGGGRYSNRSGPYDRRTGGRYTGPMGAGTSGRLSPGRSMFGRVSMPGGGAYIPAGHPAAIMGGAGFGPAGQRWDGTGTQAMGPKEAVQGRSLKSYEDLDAVGGAGGGELNY
ncbi:mucin-like protein 1 [Arthroderma uncinatum]|uniref:mucin-like protein 1 n=1 Tax=Arthroderma uncinatum TaxID=74035 RepID=UPI00144A7D7A|nr:mucin-like protein 1 [Arthroderma uncinatum]KAF3481884.1 mucin-like protein 1 [Arthroderma uncinatum]